MLFLKKLNESKIQIENLEFDLAQDIQDIFSFKIENSWFIPSVRAGIWDGTIRLFDLRNCTLPFGLFGDLLRYLKKRNIDYKVDENIKLVDFSHLSDSYLKFLIEKLGCKQKDRDYQLDAILTSLKANKCIHLLPTNAGKSFCYYLMIKCIFEKLKDSRALIIVPTVGLVTQMKHDLLDYDENCGEFENFIFTSIDGIKNYRGERIVISTWQTLQNIKSKEFFQGFETLFVDEVHCAIAKQLASICNDKCTNSKIRIGMSGTLHDSKVNRMQLKACFGRIYETVKQKDLIASNYSSPVQINILELKYPDEICKNSRSLSWDEESKFVTANKDRLIFILKLIKKINSNSLLIFKNIKYGKLIYNSLKTAYPERDIYYVAGETSTADREIVRLAMATKKDAIIVASGAVFAVGINIPSLKYLIFCQSWKSKIKVIQSIGRIVRKHKNKNKAVIFDIVDNLVYKKRENYSYKHAKERIEMYNHEEFKYEIISIKIGQ